MSNVRVRVKMGVNEIEIESSIESIRDAIDLIPEIMGKIGNNSIGIEKGNGMDRSDIPEIKIEKDDSLSDIILKIFKESWGRNARRLIDVKSTLDTYGLSYPKQSVAVTLLRLAQSGKLRRFKGEGGEFVYTAATSLLDDDNNSNINESIE